MRQIPDRLWIVALLPALLVQTADAQETEPATDKRARTLEFYRSEARGYTIYRDSSRREEAKLLLEPVYVWTNPTSSGGQEGALFVWTCQGRAEAIATFFVQPPTGRREIVHEFHSLSLSTLDVTRKGGAHTWTPEAPGITLTPIPGAPAPAQSAGARLVQMRSLLRDFSGQTDDGKNAHWTLRFLTKPLYRYTSTDPVVVDGAIFGFVSSAGTDPEAFVILEARRASPGTEAVWQSGYARFTHLNLKIRHKGTEVYSIPAISFNTGREDPKHRYRLFSDRYIEANDGEPTTEKPTAK